MQTLGSRIRHYRKQKGWTQMQLAEGICSAGSISFMERDQMNPSAYLLEQIASHLEVPMGLLLYGEAFLIIHEAVSKAITLMDSYQYQSAMFELERVIVAPNFKNHDAKSRVYYLLGTCYLEQRMYQKAIETLNKALEVIKHQSITDICTTADIHAMLSRAYEEQGMVSCLTKKTDGLYISIM